MKITIQHYDAQFNVQIASAAGKEPFLTIKGCRIVSGSNGEFVSWPSKKLDSGKWWNHVYSSEAFSKAVLDEYARTKPQAAPKRSAEIADDDVPF